MEFLPKERSPWWFFHGGVLALVSIVFLNLFLSELLGNIRALVYLLIYTQVLAFLGFRGKKTWLFWGAAGHIIGVIMLANYGEIPQIAGSMSTGVGHDDLAFCGTYEFERLSSSVNALFKIILPWFAGFFLGSIFQAITDNIAAKKDMQA